MERTRVCAFCGNEFTYKIGRGMDRRYCCPACSESAYEKKRDSRIGYLPQCLTPGCEKKANRKGSGLCEACYMRLRRKGTTDYKALPPYRTEQSAGYIWLREPTHPLADSTGLVYEHRFVFYEHNGAGPFKCYWCGAPLEWDTMDIDHLDDDKAHNDISNLVASCPVCNRKRGDYKRIAKQRAKSIQITYKGITKTPGLWAKDIGIARSTFMSRLERWPIERAMGQAKGPTGPKPRQKACHAAKTEQEEKERG